MTSAPVLNCKGVKTMYIQITTRCNMECDHCCYSCVKDKGDDMTPDTFKAALELCEEYGQTLSIGGGEPTVHPNFWEFMGMAVFAEIEEGCLWLATNGKRTKDALKLASLARRGVIACDLSQDDYHEGIDQAVIDAFPDTRSNRSDNDYRGVRNVGRDHKGKWRPPFAVGRGKNISGAVEGCVCEDILVKPDGRIYRCACELEQFGTVFDPEIPDDISEYDCSKHTRRN